jgi:release factor glutamine methyltransferase
MHQGTGLSIMGKFWIAGVMVLSLIVGIYISHYWRSREMATPRYVVSEIKKWGKVEEFEQKLAILDSVFWEPADTESLRKRIRETELVRDKRVLEIGTGTGLVALCCLKAKARSVVATDVNPAAIESAKLNAKRLGLSSSFEARQVSLSDTSAFSVIDPSEQFDVILSNPPWEDGEPRYIDQYALYDTRFALLESLFAGLDTHLADEGELYLAYGCKTAIERVKRIAEQDRWRWEILDDRPLSDLPEVFLPGMLIRVRR